MDRKEFCEILVKNKKESGIGTKEMCSTTSLNGNAVYRIERGVSNFTLELALKYINAINHTITLHHVNQKRKTSISHYSDFLIFLKKIKKSYTERDLSALVGCSETAIGEVLRQRHIVSIDTFLKLLEVLGYQLTIDTIPVMIPHPIVYNSVFSSNIEHRVVSNTNSFFKDLIETTGWYKRDPFMYPQKAQIVKKKYHNNLLGLDEMTHILINSGCIYDLKITSPDGGTYFSDYATAYEILSKIYNINKTLGIDSLEAHKIKDGNEKRLRIDVILQFLIKIGCDIDIKWELPELVEI